MTDPTSGTTAADAPAVRLVRRIEDDARLDAVADALVRAARVLTASPARSALLLGEPAGHAAHPALTDVPIGAWTSATVLDVVGGRAARPAARRLVGLGVLSALPTLATGLAELEHVDVRSRRVGALHAVGNGTALALYAASWLARRREHHARGTLLALAGAGVAAGSGYLGGHLAVARNVGSRSAAFADSLPADRPAGRTTGRTTARSADPHGPHTDDLRPVVPS